MLKIAEDEHIQVQVGIVAVVHHIAVVSMTAGPVGIVAGHIATGHTAVGRIVVDHIAVGRTATSETMDTVAHRIVGYTCFVAVAVAAVVVVVEEMRKVSEAVEENRNLVEGKEQGYMEVVKSQVEEAQKEVGHPSDTVVVEVVELVNRAHSQADRE